MSNIKLITLEGTKYRMGVEYGKQLVSEMKASLGILYKFFVNEHNVSLERLTAKADQFYQKYPFSYQQFIKGVAQGSGLSLDEVKILNGMETLYALKDEQQEIGACAFLAVPPTHTVSNYNIIGRNYDFPEPYNKIASYLTVTVLKEIDAIPTAIIGLPGQIYCPSCINANSLFIELNNGMPSGGYEVNHDAQSMLITLLEIAQNSESFAQMDKLLSARDSDYSLVINTANKTHVKSYEFSSFKGDKHFVPNKNSVFVSTNFFQNETWDSNAELTDESTWLGISRRSNLINGVKENSSIEDVKQLLDVHHSNSGAKWDLTIYQIIFDTNTQELCLKVPQEDTDWTCFNDIFSNNFVADLDLML